MMTSYYRLCKSLNDKGILVPEGFDFEKYKQGEAYISAYKYNEDHYKIFTDKGTVAGISDVKTDTIFFDLDCGGDIEKARQDTITVCQRLSAHSINLDDVRICISGSKGFHVTIHTSRDYNPEEVKSFAINIAGDLDSFDSSVYNANRIMRMEGSIHPKTNLRKTRLSFDELSRMSIVEIKNISKDVYAFEKTKKISLPEELTKVRKVEKKVETVHETVDYLSNPFNLQPQKLALSQGFFPNGQRSNALIILASTLKNKGMLDKQCYYALKAAADLQSSRYGSDKFSKDEIWNNIIKQVYSPNWKDGSYSEDNFSTQLKEYFHELGVPKTEESELANAKYDPVMLGDIGDTFENFVLNYDQNVIKTGIKDLDKDMPLTPGMNLGIIGAPGSGKTSLALKLLEYCSANGIYCILGSLDMHRMRLYEKVLYRVSGLSREELYAKFKNGEAEEIKAKVRDLFKTTYIYDKSSATVDDIRNYHKAIEARDGVKIKMTMVDYFERVNSDISDDTASSKKVAGEWQDYINDFNVVGIMYVQPNKISLSGGPNCPILDYRSIKGSSFLYQSFRGIMSLWRPFYTPQTAEYDKYMQMALLKNDLGELKMYEYGWDGKRGEIYELDYAEKKLLKDLLDEKNGTPEDF